MVRDSGGKQVSSISKSFISSKGEFHTIYEAYTYKLAKCGSHFSLLLCTNVEVKAGNQEIELNISNRAKYKFNTKFKFCQSTCLEIFKYTSVTWKTSGRKRCTLQE